MDVYIILRFFRLDWTTRFYVQVYQQSSPVQGKVLRVIG